MTRLSNACAGERSGQSIVVALLIALVAFVVLAALVGAHVGGGLDGRVISWMELHDRQPLTGIALGFDWVGTWWLAIALTALLVGVLAWRGLRSQARYLALTMAASLTLNLLLKLVFRRTPPGGSAAASPSVYGFPSGHTMSATAFAAAIVLIAWPTRWRWPVLAAGAAFAIGMGLSRVYLAVHWPSDVIAGWVMGICVALAARAAVRLPSRASHMEKSEAAISAGASPGGSTPSLASTPGATGPTSLRKRKAPVRPIEVVFLDWGNTLMVDDGTQAGSMAAWPHVTAVDGAAEVLRTLHARYRLLVATNADDSGSAEIRAALARVGLEGLVDDVVSSRDVKARKPEGAFYRAALLRAGFAGLPLAAESAVMVGDSLENDVAGAMAAGLRTVWLARPRAARLRGGPSPDARIRKLAELPAALARLGGPAPAEQRFDAIAVDADDGASASCRTDLSPAP
jgi:membrane-associated phospholipid phosphatase/phosphoglycolate phosphatase-like HAD superfamily hydrolase